MLTLALSSALLLQKSNQLLVDPLLVRQAAEVWSVLGQRPNPVWPGWDVQQTPLLIYLPGKQDLLINHPKPPAGFEPYTGPVRFPAPHMMIKNGATIQTMDGQNTSMDVAGVQTLVVADKLSNLRQQMDSLLDQAAGGKRPTEDEVLSALQSDPYDSMLMFAHEAFHVYQHHKAPDKAGNELALTKYPSLDVDNNTGYALEAEALRDALRAPENELRKQAIKWLAIRLERRKSLTPACIAYEDGTEFNEGLAKYVEYRTLQVLQGRKPAPDMWLVQGFHGYADLDSERHRLEDQMVSLMSGKTNVNNDPYGASPVRFRLYYSGMGAAALLNRLGAKWNDSILEPKTTLTALVMDAVKPTETELADAYRDVTSSSAYQTILEEKQKLANDGKAHIQTVLSGFDSAPGKVVLDYSALAKPKVGFAFTPFGVLAVDSDRTVFRLVPIRGLIGPVQFSEDSSRPVLSDYKNKTVTMTTTGTITEAMLEGLGPDWKTKPVSAGKLELPGLTASGIDGTISLDGKTLTIRLQ